MADRYWVGGTASWDGTAGTKWALTSGGAGGQAIPTSADDVFFDSASGANTVTIATGNTGAKSINCNTFTGTLAGTAAITVSGSVTLVAGMTFTYSGTLTLAGTGTLTSAGKTLGPVTINGSGITVTLGDALNIAANTLTLTQGTFTTSASNYSISAGGLNISGSTARTLTLNASTVTFTTASAITSTTTTNLTLNSGTSTIICSASAAQVIFGSSGTPLAATLYNLSFTSTTAGTIVIRGLLTLNNLTFAGPASAGVTTAQIEGYQTISGTLSTTGTAGNRRVGLRSQTYGLSQTLTINSAPSLTDADFRDIYVVGTAAPISGTRIGDLRGCRGITFDAPKSVYWVTLAGGSWSGNNWAPGSGGTASTNSFPLAQDTAVIENTGLNTSAQILFDLTDIQVGSINMSTRTNAMTLNINSSGSRFIYGDWINGTGTTISNTATLTFSGRNTQTITSAGKTFTGGVTVDTYGGTVELADALNIGSSILTVTNGTFDTKSYNVTAGTLSSNNSNVRTITLGSSTVTVSSTPVTFTTSTNLTFNSGTSTITCSGTTITFNGGGMTFYDVSFTNNVTSTKTIAGANTFRNLLFTAPLSAGVQPRVFSANQTITGTLTVDGATSIRRGFVQSDTLGTPRTLTVGTLSATDCDFRDITIDGTAAGSSPTRGGDCGGNTGITFPVAKTVYWNLAGTQNWSATGWAPSSGGAVDINQFPLAQDSAVFDNTGSAGTVTIDAAWNIGTFDASLRTTAMTLALGAVDPFVYGNWKFGTGVTASATTQFLQFAKQGAQTITSNGVTFGSRVSIVNAATTVQLADAISVSTTNYLRITSGTFDASIYNCTMGLFDASNSNIRTLKLGSGTWTITGTGSCWTVLTTTNLAFYKGTANIVLSDTSTTARQFDGGGLSYNKLTIGGATGTSTLTITGNNQFTELASTKTVAHTIALGSTAQTFGKWTVTGTVGNVVTLTGTGASHVLAGAATSGIDYLAMGSIGFAATSPGEFYAGANSTGTAAAPVYRTAPPAGATRYWVGGTGNWSSTTKWSASSGGGSGASVPTSLDNVVFDSASNATAYTATIDAAAGGVRMKSLTIAGPASGNVTLAGSQAIAIHDNVTLPATGLTRTYTGAITLAGSTTGRTLTTNGVALGGAIAVNGVSCGWSLSSALNNPSDTVTITNGTFDSANFTVTIAGISSNNANTRTVSFGSSVINLAGANSVTFGTTETSLANLTFTAGTSQINCSSSIPTLSGNNQTFYNVSFTGTTPNPVTLNGVNSFNNLSFTGVTSAGLKNISLTANQTVTGTLTFSAGTDATMRHFCRSDTIGTTRTITAAAVSMTDVDFRDITIAGAAAPASGTRIGDCKGNSGITFTAAANKYWNLAGGGNWGGALAWALTSGGAPALNNFPLAQDTCLFEATSPNNAATVTLNAAYNIGTIDMSGRTANTMTLATGSTTPTIYGNWVNGTGTTPTGSGAMTFAGRGSQTITSAGVTFTQSFTIDTPAGSVTLQDAFITNRASSTAIYVIRGTFEASTYNVTLSGTTGGVDGGSSTFVRTIAVGSGTWTIAGSGNAWSINTTNLTVTGTGTISLTSASAKTFAGGGIAYTGITLNQGGAGALTITGNNTLKDITNTYKATGATNITMGTTTQQVAQWTAAGEAGRLLTVQGTSASSPCTLVHTGTGIAANVDYLVVTGVRAY